MAKAASGLRVLIDDILDLSKVESDRITLHPIAFCVTDLLDECLSIADGPARAKGLALHMSRDSRVPEWLIGDSSRIRQILLNLLLNAVKFTSRGSVQLGVRAEKVDGDQATVKFFVSDTGAGIDEETRSRLFQRFVQGDESISRAFGGTGLGLAISKGLVTLMGGEIGLDSEVGKGSTFWFTLPLKVAEVPVSESNTLKAEAPPRVLRVLVVEDNEMNRDLVRTMLVRLGHEVTVAIDGYDSIRQFRENRYDIILMDIRMPGIDGIETTRQMRALGGDNRDVPIIAMTANVMSDQIGVYRAASMNDFLGKPLDAKDLVRILARWYDPKSDKAAEAPAPAPSQVEVIEEAKMTAPAPSQADAGKVAPAATAQEPSALPVHDQAALQTVKELLGEEKTEIFLGNLGKALSGIDQAPDGSDRQAMARYAHSFVSLSGQLGFAKMSAVSRALETACLTGEGIDAAMATFKAAGAEAREALAGVMKSAPRAQQAAAAEAPQKALRAS